MAATSGKQYSVGLRHARVYELDVNGRPAASSTAVYEGVQMSAAKAYTVNQAGARRIAHIGDDHLKATDFLPPIESSESTLRVGRNDHDVHAVLTNTKAFTIGEAAGIGYGSEKRGAEPDVAMLLYQQSLDATSKLRHWRSYILPVTKAVIRAASMDENPAENTYDLLMQVCTKHLWGIAMTEGVEGFTEAELLEFMFKDLPLVVAWKGDNVEDEFLFHTDRQAVSTSKIHVVTTTTTGGVVTDVTGTVTKAVTGITFAAAPATGVIVTCLYEYAAG